MRPTAEFDAVDLSDGSLCRIVRFSHYRDGYSRGRPVRVCCGHSFLRMPLRHYCHLDLDDTFVDVRTGARLRRLAAPVQPPATVVPGTEAVGTAGTAPVASPADEERAAAVDTFASHAP